MCQVSELKEIIEYRGHTLNVNDVREQLQSFKNSDGSPYFSVDEVERQVQRYIMRWKRCIGRLEGSVNREKYQGFRLAFYLKERELYPEAFETKVDDRTAELLVKKLYRHFYDVRSDFTPPVRFYGNRQSGKYYSVGFIRLCHNPSIGLICHEVAHRKFKRHNKKMLKFMKKLINYCAKKGYIKRGV